MICSSTIIYFLGDEAMLGTGGEGLVSLSANLGADSGGGMIPVARIVDGRLQTCSVNCYRN